MDLVTQSWKKFMLHSCTQIVRKIYIPFCIRSLVSGGQTSDAFLSLPSKNALSCQANALLTVTFKEVTYGVFILLHMHHSPHFPPGRRRFSPRGEKIMELGGEEGERKPEMVGDILVKDGKALKT